MKTDSPPPTMYDSGFYALLTEDSLRSARLIVPIVMELLCPKSVLDVGCGPGAWLRAFTENGVRIIRGIDGNYVSRDNLLVDAEHFYPADLNQPISVDGDYDLAVCIEVAEHLPESSGAALIDLLTSAAPSVVFSAAIPGQGGRNHINEQWITYWRRLFAVRNFMMVDPFRPKIRDDVRIAPYLRQNLVMFRKQRELECRAVVRNLPNDRDTYDNEWVHVEHYEKWLRLATKELGTKEIFAKLPGAIRHSIQRRLIRRKG